MPVKCHTEAKYVTSWFELITRHFHTSTTAWRRQGSVAARIDLLIAVLDRSLCHTIYVSIDDKKEEEKKQKPIK